MGLFWCFSGKSNMMDMEQEWNKGSEAQREDLLPLNAWLLRPGSRPHSWNTIYNTCWVWWFDKNWKVKNKRNLLVCHNRLNITQSGLDMKSYFYSSVDTLAWLTVLMKAWMSLAALMIKLKLWKIQELQTAKVVLTADFWDHQLCIKMHQYSWRQINLGSFSTSVV